LWDAKGSSTLNSSPGAQQSMWMPYETWCDHCVRLFAGTDLDIWHDLWSFSVTVQLHTAHVGHKGYFCCFAGNLWIIHPIVWPCTFRIQVSCVGATKATLGTSPVPHNEEVVMALNSCKWKSLMSLVTEFLNLC